MDFACAIEVWDALLPQVYPTTGCWLLPRQRRAATAALLLQLDAIACEVSVMDMPISLFVEIPETLHQSLATFLDTRPEWDQDRVFSAAISLFLLQNRLPEQVSDRNAARIYLDALFGDSVFGHANPEFPSTVPQSLGANQIS
ncbi:MAG: hypothetical protein RLZZ511_1321 [Cyanobacteriota bacterium]|jgi:hypothetical protein